MFSHLRLNGGFYVAHVPQHRGEEVARQVGLLPLLETVVSQSAMQEHTPVLERPGLSYPHISAT